MTEYEVGDIIINTYYNVHCLILKKTYGSIGYKSCITLLLTQGDEKHHTAGSTITWAGWPNSSGPWDFVA